MNDNQFTILCDRLKDIILLLDQLICAVEELNDPEQDDDSPNVPPTL